MEVVETTSSQTEESVSIEAQHVDPRVEDNSGEQRHKRVKMVQAQTQTQELKGRDKFTQTPAVFHNNQETQTDDNENAQPGPTSAESQLKEDKQTPEPKLRDDSTVQSQLMQNEKPDSVRATSDSAKEQNLKTESKFKEEHLSAGASGDPTDARAQEGVKPKSYAKAVSGEGGTERQSNMEASKAADRTPKPSQSSR